MAALEDDFENYHGPWFSPPSGNRPRRKCELRGDEREQWPRWRGLS